MKRSTKKFFILFFSSFIFLALFGFSATSVRADIIHTPTITANHLDVSAGSFSGPNTWGSSKQIHCYTGGQDLLSFENLGQVGYDSENNQLLYKAIGKFGFETVIYSTVSPSGVDSGFLVNKKTSVPFLWVRKFSWIGDPYMTTTVYNIDYNEVDFEIENTHKYTGYYPISVGIKNTQGFSGELEIGPYTFEMPAMTYDVMSLKVNDYHHSAVGLWDNEFIDYNQYEEGRLTIESVTEHTANQKVVDYINNRANIGWKVGPIGTPITLQNSMVFGDTGYSVNDGVFNLNFGLQPKITETRQYNEYTWAKIWWDYLDTWLISPSGMGFEGGPSTKPLERTVAANIENMMMYWNFETEIHFYMTVQPDHILSAEELQEPFFEQGNWVWDTTFQGEIPTLPEDSGVWDLLGGIFGIMWMLIIAFAVVVILIVIFKTKMFKRG